MFRASALFCLAMLQRMPPYCEITVSFVDDDYADHVPLLRQSDWGTGDHLPLVCWSSPEFFYVKVLLLLKNSLYFRYTPCIKGARSNQINFHFGRKWDLLVWHKVKTFLKNDEALNGVHSRHAYVRHSSQLFTIINLVRLHKIICVQMVVYCLG